MKSLVLLALAGTAHGATLVVDPSAPRGLHRISDAVAAAAPGDVIEVRAGVYTDENRPIVVDKPGLTIAGVPARAAVVRPSMPVKNAFPAIFYVTGAGVTIRGLHVDGQRNIDIGIYVDGGDGFLIQDNWIRFAGTGLITRQASGAVDGNLIGTDSPSNADLPSFNGLGGHFGAVIGGGTPAEVWITRNTVAENGFSGTRGSPARATG
jgi:hypothetical protein